MDTLTSTGKITVKNPINQSELYQIEETGTEQIEQVMQRARQVQPLIENFSVKQRVQEMLKVNDYIIKHKEEIITRIVEETGKSRFDALATEVFEILDVIDYFKKAAPKMLKEKKVHTPIVLMGKKSKVILEPLGTVLIIAPWNYPFYQCLVPSLLAFLAGNAVVFKPSEHTSLKGLVEEVLTGSGFLKNAIQVVYGSKSTGQKLIDAQPDKIHFTGSVATGKKIMEQASKYLIPVDLELGGKDPSLVFEDVNIERTVNGVLWGAFTSCGQSCTSIERLYVHESIHEPFLKMLVEKAKLLRSSNPQRNYKSSEDCDVGAMTTEFQVQIVEKHIADAVEKGAKVLTGGKRDAESLHFPPTVLSDVTHEMLIATEETFGPVLPVMKFKTEEEAISLANDSIYGLSASVWSKDLKRANRVARKIKTGNVSINSHMMTEGNPALPFGGVKNSGFGRYKGEFGLQTFSNIKSIIEDKQSSKIEAHWYPYTTTKYNLLSNVITSLFSRSKNLVKFALIGLNLDNVGSKEKLK